MSDFEKYWEEIASKESWANKAVAWSIWKEKQAIIDEHTEVIKLQDADLRKYEKQIEELQKTNISLEAGLRKNSKNKQKLLGKNIELQKRIDEALVIIEKHSRYVPFSAEQAIREALRGAND